MNKEEVKALIDIYGKAWEQQDVDLILTIFTDDATYNDPKEGQCVGKEEIKAYWNQKVLNEQKDIHFKLLNLWVDNETAIAEWQADFVDTKRNLQVHLLEVAIFSIKEGKFGSLREYYSSTKTPIE